MDTLKKTVVTILVALLVLPLPFFIFNVNGQGLPQKSNHCADDLTLGISGGLGKYHLIVINNRNESVSVNANGTSHGIIWTGYDHLVNFFVAPHNTTIIPVQTSVPIFGTIQVTLSAAEKTITRKGYIILGNVIFRRT